MNKSHFVRSSKRNLPLTCKAFTNQKPWNENVEMKAYLDGSIRDAENFASETGKVAQ